MAKTPAKPPVTATGSGTPPTKPVTAPKTTPVVPVTKADPVPAVVTSIIYPNNDKRFIVIFDQDMQMKGDLKQKIFIVIDGQAPVLPSSVSVKGKDLICVFLHEFTSTNVVTWSFDAGDPGISLESTAGVQVATTSHAIDNQTPAPVVPVTWKTPPVAAKTFEYGATYTKQTTEAEGGTGPYTYTNVPATVNTRTSAGSTVNVVYKAEDTKKVEITKTTKVTVSAKKPIVIVIGGGGLGITTMDVPFGGVFTKPTATASGGFGTLSAVTSTGTVNTQKAGTYPVTYSVTDGDTPPETETKILQVTVLAKPADHDIPVIALHGGDMVIDQGSTYVEPGYTAHDKQDGDITANVIVTGGTFDTSVVATHTISYSVDDAAGNHAVPAKRNVQVKAVVVPPTLGNIEKDFIEGQKLRNGEDVHGSWYDIAVDEARNVQSPDVHPAYTNAVMFDEGGMDPYEVAILKNGIPK